MWFVITCVCECDLLCNVFVCTVRDVLGDVVRLVFLCVLSVFVRFMYQMWLCALLVMCDVMLCGLCWCFCDCAFGVLVV